MEGTINKNILKYQRKKRKNFEKYIKFFPNRKSSSFENYADIYLKYFRTNYRDYLYDFCALLKRRGFKNLDTCKIEELLWNKFRYGDYKYESERKNDLNKMSGIQFEDLLHIFFSNLRYSVIRTKRSNDNGADLILQTPDYTCAVQAKRQKKTVGIKAIQEVVMARIYYGTTDAMVITTSKFSKKAIINAKVAKVILWDGEILKSELKRHNFNFY